MKNNTHLERLYLQYADNLAAIKRMKKQNDILLLRMTKLVEQGGELPLEAKVISVSACRVSGYVRKGYIYLR